ncbi:MAG: DNA repair protein RecN [Acidobacteriota bacterium]
MLRDLHLRNLAVLASAEVEFGRGFNVLTGETGAGKSIVVDALALLAGARSSTDLIRSGVDTLSVTGVFHVPGAPWREALEAAGLEVVGDELVVRREVGREGRNRVFLNDQPATLRLLTDLAPDLLRIHGQREELGLVEPDLQRAWLDRSGGAEAAAVLDRTAASFDCYATLAARLERIAGDERLRRERLDLLRFQAAEIDAAKPQAGEEEALRAERQVLRHVEAITQGLTGTLDGLEDEEGAALERLAHAGHLLEGIADYEPQARAWQAEIAECRIRLVELSSAVRHRLDHVEADPGRLDAVEERLSVLERLLRKYGPGTVEMLARRAEIARELDELEGDASDRLGLESKVATALGEYRAAAEELSRRRAEWGRGLAERVQVELRDLALERAQFAVGLSARPRQGSPLIVKGEPVEFAAHGYDQVVFELKANPGEEARPLQRAASGGELARIYLALQLALTSSQKSAPANSLPTMVFDEVDTGLGGAEAAAVGKKLRRLAARGQILAVTHLPQVASQGHLQFRVSKRVDEGRTHATVAELGTDERVAEVARMLAGEQVTSLSMSHARELLDSAIDSPGDPPGESPALSRGSRTERPARAARTAKGSRA